MHITYLAHLHYGIFLQYSRLFGVVTGSITFISEWKKTILRNTELGKPIEHSAKLQMHYDCFSLDTEVLSNTDSTSFCAFLGFTSPYGSLTLFRLPRFRVTF